MALSIAENVAQVRRRIAQAAARVNRSEKEIRLIAVSKTFPAEKVREALNAGITEIGENYVQEAVEKLKSLPDSVSWHMIGRLQRNKIKAVMDAKCSCIQTVESLSQGEEVAKRAKAAGIVMPVLIEVNLGQEATKGGVTSEKDLFALAKSLTSLDSLSFQGLMTIPPPLAHPEEARPYFRQFRQMKDRLAAFLALPHLELSMGMTGDFEVAIEEGSTMIRVGTAIFGPRTDL